METEEVVAIDKAGAPENLREFGNLNDLKLSGKAHKKRLRAKQKERSDEEINVIVRKLGKTVEGLTVPIVKIISAKNARAWVSTNFI